MKLFTVLLCAFSSLAMAKDSITLTLASQMDGGHRYYHELIYEALTEAGYDVRIEVPSEHIPQKRVLKMVEANQLSMTWLIATKERDKRYVSIDVPLTNGLIGKRVLLIPPKLQPVFDKVTDLDDLRATQKVAGLGVNWFDVDVWRANRLKIYRQDGEWRNLYDRLTLNGAVNYFPRGLNEVGSEAEQHPNLAIEQRLLLVYERDFKFYLSPDMAPYRTKIEQALIQAKSSGLIDRLVKKHWGASIEQLKPAQRVVIKLELPASASQKR
ncbi:hypothetical protein [Vibrio brasiliensis]|uniref:hypothetical protein n=1 Tax=Vibrio brasiliensis TaxID=170652 RepID=UPI001EFDCBF9|nr:hypothetical protein [Vibrio brasiliensis]MCG9724943.1 hypothetical protein [Vibrio brasiliensis]